MVIPLLVMDSSLVFTRMYLLAFFVEPFAKRTVVYNGPQLSSRDASVQAVAVGGCHMW